MNHETRILGHEGLKATELCRAGAVGALLLTAACGGRSRARTTPRGS